MSRRFSACFFSASRRLHSPQAGSCKELLERSGVLRQPQVGVVDFVHRTFLEYMAALALRCKRAILDCSLRRQRRTIGERQSFSRQDIHAQGKQRDELITKLLKAPFFALRGRTVEADVTAACCLETAGANLEPALL